MDLFLTRKNEKYIASVFKKFTELKELPESSEIRQKLKTLSEKGLLDFLNGHFPLDEIDDEHSSIFKSNSWRALAAMDADLAFSAYYSVFKFNRLLANMSDSAVKSEITKAVSSGEKIGSVGICEESSGHSVADRSCKAETKNDQFIISGKKVFVCNALFADYSIISAKLDGSEKESLFLVDLSSGGLTRNQEFESAGFKKSGICSLELNEVRIPTQNLIGKADEASSILSAIETERNIYLANLALGIAISAYEKSRSYASERKIEGRPIAKIQGVHFKIAEMKVEIETTELLLNRCAWTLEKGLKADDLGRCVRLMSSKMVKRVADEAMQVFGAWGFTDKYGIDKIYQNARAFSLIEDSDENIREKIAFELLGF